MPLPEVDYGNPVLDLKFHDAVQPRRLSASRRRMGFGLGLPDPADPNRFKTKLTYDEYGRTNNVCVRIGQTSPIEYLLGGSNRARGSSPSSRSWARTARATG